MHRDRVLRDGWIKDARILIQAHLKGHGSLTLTSFVVHNALRKFLLLQHSLLAVFHLLSQFFVVASFLFDPLLKLTDLFLLHLVTFLFKDSGCVSALTWTWDINPLFAWRCLWHFRENRVLSRLAVNVSIRVVVLIVHRHRLVKEISAWDMDTLAQINHLFVGSCCQRIAIVGRSW